MGSGRGTSSLVTSPIGGAGAVASDIGDIPMDENLTITTKKCTDANSKTKRRWRRVLLRPKTWLWAAKWGFYAYKLYRGLTWLKEFLT